MQSSLYSISSTTSTIPEKRRRRTGKRDDRTQPKSVQPLPRRQDGSIALPVTIGRGTNEVIIYNIGAHQSFLFHDIRRIDLLRRGGPFILCSCV